MITAISCVISSNAFSQITVSTYAGTGISGFTDGDALTQAQFSFPIGVGVCVGTDGAVYVADRQNHAVRKINNGIVSTLAGNGTSGYVDATGANARFSFPTAITIDANDNLYVAEFGNCVIRKVTQAGVVTTVAGIPGSCGFQNGPASTAKFFGLHGITIDSIGHLYVAETGNHLIRKIDTNGTVSTYAGQFVFFSGGYLDGPASTARFARPTGLAFDNAGNLFVAEEDNHTIRKISTSLVVSTVAGVNNIGAGTGNGGFMDGGALTVAEFNSPTDLTVDDSGNIFVTDQDNQRIRKIASGIVTTFAGGGPVGPGNGSFADGIDTIARFNEPFSICHDENNILYVADANNHRIRKISELEICNGFANASFDVTIQSGEIVQIGNIPVTGLIYSWSPLTSLNDPNIANPYASPGTTTDYILTVNDSIGCEDKDTVTVFIDTGIIVTVRHLPSFVNDSAKNIIIALGANVLHASDYFDRVIIDGFTPAILDTLSTYNWVTSIDTLPSAIDNNDESSALILVDDIQSVPWSTIANPFNLTGNGVKIGMWESGKADLNNNDFAGRIFNIDLFGTTSAHATHVCGTMAGTGANSISQSGSNFQWAGMAPEATIYTWSLAGIGGWQTAFDEMLDGVTNQQIVISQNSWSQAIQTGCVNFQIYDNTCIEADKLVHDENLSIFFSAGNYQQARLILGCGTQYGTVLPLGTAKNVVTVGAVDKSSNMTSFSGWGPALDGRVKPDIVAIGEDVYSDDLSNNAYFNMSGTSTSAPAASGTAALLIQQIRDLYGFEPLPALVKAILLNTADDLGLPGPDLQTGYGRINALCAAVLVEDENFLNSSVADQAITDDIINISDPSPTLKIMLVYTDPDGSNISPAPALINDLDLQLIDPFGNIHLPLTIVDPINNPASQAVEAVNFRDNVEQVVIQNPVCGNWTVRVIGTNIPTGTQDYAVTWDVCSSTSLIDAINSTNVCQGGSTGTATVDVSGGTPNYNYIWTPGPSTINTPSTSDQITGLTAGVYTVDVTDDNGCTASTSVTVGDENIGFWIWGFNPTAAACPGNQDLTSPCPGDELLINLQVFNTGTVNIPVGTIVSVDLPDNMNVVTPFSSSFYCPNIQFNGIMAGNVLEWEIVDANDLQPGDFCYLRALVDNITLPAPYVVDVTVTTPNCVFTFTHTWPNACTCSLDPNNKLVVPSGCSDKGIIESQKLEYSINFQNIGTGPATKVVLRDTIDSDLILDSLVIIAASHNITSVTIDQSTRVLTVSFDSIFLPPLVDDELRSVGGIKYTIVPESGLPNGAEILNKTAIFFDFNPPVITNEVINAIVNDTSISLDAGNDTVVFLGYAVQECVDLTATATGGLPPYTFVWSTGDTGQTINVCPTQLTTFTVTAFYADGCPIAVDSVTVEVMDVQCGNNKVLICHIPPGNPSNSHEICVSANAVPAHLANHGDNLGPCVDTSSFIDSSNLKIHLPSSGVFLNSVPNPLSQKTTIAFSVPAKGNVTLEMPGLKSGKAITLFDGFVEADVLYTVEFDASGYSGGIYFCRLITATGATETRKLIIIK